MACCQSLRKEGTVKYKGIAPFGVPPARTFLFLAHSKRDTDAGPAPTHMAIKRLLTITGMRNGNVQGDQKYTIYDDERTPENTAISG